MNDTIRKALGIGIVEGERLLHAKLSKLGNIVNGWDIVGMTSNGSNVKFEIGSCGTDYLLRAAIAKNGIWPNSPEESFYASASTDIRSQNLTGSHKYLIHFDKDQIPPVKAFWSLTLYNATGYLVDNPINRYSIGDRTPGIKHNQEGSLDIYIQHDNPGKDKESNWLAILNWTLRNDFETIQSTRTSIER